MAFVKPKVLKRITTWPSDSTNDTDPKSTKNHYKLQLCKSLLQHSSYPIRIPETLIKSQSQPVVFLMTGKTGVVTSVEQGAVEAFMTQVGAVVFANQVSKPSPYRLPMFIAFGETRPKLLFSIGDLMAFLEREERITIQRYIVSPGGRAMKVRVKWGAETKTSSRNLCRKSRYPFNSLSILKPSILVRARHGSIVIQNSGLKLERRNTQQLSFPVLFPTVKSPSPSHLSLKVFSSFSSFTSAFMPQDPYTVSFSIQFDTYEDSPLLPGLESAAMEIVAALQEGNALQGLDMQTVEFDMMQGVSSLWYFLDVKQMTTESVEQRVGVRLEALGHPVETVKSKESLKRTLHKLQTFFLSDQPLIQHKAPFLPRPTSHISFASFHC